MAGILDFIDSNWSSLLGIPNPSPPPPPPTATPSPAMFSPSGVGDVQALTGQPVTMAPAQPFPPQDVPPSGPFYDPLSGGTIRGPGPLATGAPQPSANWPAGPSAGPSLTTPANAAPLPPSSSVATPPPTSPVPLPPPRPAPTIPTSTGPVSITPSGISPNFGIDATTLQLPPPTAGPTTATTGNWATALGLNRQPVQDAITRGLAGLGRGLERVGSLPFGASGAQAFAAGAGGGLTGGIQQLELQQQQRRQAELDSFNMKSQAFRDMQLGEQTANAALVARARAAWYSAGALQRTAGGKGANIWFNNIYGRTEKANKEADDLEKSLRNNLDKKWAREGTPTVQQEQDLANMRKRVESLRQERYKQYNVDPNKAELLSNAGKSKDNPYDTSRMTQDEFDAGVPLGAWYDTGKKFGTDGAYSYTGADGKPAAHYGKPGDPVILQRTVGPQAQAQGPTAAQVYQDELMNA